MHYSSFYEAIADAIPDAIALVHGDDVRRWGDYDDRAARLAAGFATAGLVPDSKVGIYLYNCNEWMEALHAALKMRAVPVNVNYRYLDEELVYLLDDADVEAVVYHAAFAERLDHIRSRLPKVRLYAQVGGGAGSGPVPDWAVDYELLIAANEPAPRIARRDDDVMFTYTGGTTGMPKGVINPVGTSSRAAGGTARGGLAIPDWPDEPTPEFAVRLHERGGAPVTCVSVPLMHSSGLSMGAMPTLLSGGCVVTLTAHGFDPAELLRTSVDRRVTSIVIAGDAIARPLLHELETTAAEGRSYDLSALRVIMSAGVAWSGEVKLGLLEFMPHVTLQDGSGSTEGGIGVRLTRKGDPVSTNVFTPMPGLKVLREDGTEVAPGSGEAGRIATRSHSLGYYKDPEKTNGVFLELDGERYVMAGDFALREPDGSIILLGRGSTVINTGGEKVFPEEVEEVIKTYRGVADAIVTGTPHERFGAQVTAVVSLFAGEQAVEADVIAHVRGRLADYKAPKRVVFVAEVPRHPNGKPNLELAHELALAGGPA